MDKLAGQNVEAKYLSMTVDVFRDFSEFKNENKKCQRHFKIYKT